MGIFPSIKYATWHTCRIKIQSTFL